jgi:uncharacterized protein YbjT (DUF2867 family)
MKALILGATGMVGSEVLKACLASDQITNVLSIGRRKSGISHSKLKEMRHDNFLNFSSIQDVFIDVDVVYYCLGVYQNQVSKEEFWKITVDYQEALIRSLEKSAKEITFCLFSAQGADPKERMPILFAKAKGRAERKLIESRLAKKYIFRPGFINPDNGARSDIWVKLFLPIYRILPFIGIDASELGRAMVSVGLRGCDHPILENKDIKKVTKETKPERLS